MQQPKKKVYEDIYEREKKLSGLMGGRYAIV
jgi:hypothetical protein